MFDLQYLHNIRKTYDTLNPGILFENRHYWTELSILTQKYNPKVLI